MADIDIAENEAFERAELRVRRLAWKALLLLVLGSIIGIFGPGILGRSEAVGNLLEVRFSRFERTNSPAELVIMISPEAVHDGGVQLWFSRDYIDAFEVSSVTPIPKASFSAGDRVVYEFQAAPGMPAKIAFHLRVSEAAVGRLEGRLGVHTGGEASFWQFVWP
jgi:hypothetical protein